MMKPTKLFHTACLLPVLFSHPIMAANYLTGLIGVNYQPNHYPTNNAFNFHDVFVVGNAADGKPITNIYMELSQLKAAGFNTVRSYQTTDYAWIDLINQANRLGMNVIYEAVIPQSGNNSDITAATTLLNTVMNAVGVGKFNSTVSLIFAGHENYCDTCSGGSSNITYLTSAVAALQAAAPGVPVSSAVVSGDFVTPSRPILTDMNTLINSYSATAPMAFDPYPFQWGVPIADAVGTISGSPTINSIGYDFAATMTNFAAQYGTRTLLIAESGWASSGTTNPGYACNNPPMIQCSPSVSNEATYFSNLYQFVNNPSNNSGLLAFEAYDEPAKVADSTNMEDYYGIFDQNCNLKGPNNLTLIPNQSYSPSANLGCQGYTNGALMTIIGFGHPYTLIINQTNPITNLMSTITVTSNGVSGPIADAPWSHYLVFPGATITIRGNPSCTSTVQSINSTQQITFSGSCNCPNNNSNNCFY